MLDHLDALSTPPPLKTFNETWRNFMTLSAPSQFPFARKHLTDSWTTISCVWLCLFPFIRLTLHSSHLQEVYLSLRLVMQPCFSKCSNHHPSNALLNHLRTLSMSSKTHKVLFSVTTGETSQATLILRNNILRWSRNVHNGENYGQASGLIACVYLFSLLKSTTLRRFFHRGWPKFPKRHFQGLQN